MKNILCYIVLFLLFSGLKAQELNPEVFSILNLDYKGLEVVKELYRKGKSTDAATALLDYYRNRTGIKHPDIDLNKVSLSKQEQQWADDGLKHIFFVHYGYQPSYFYGDDINWQFWPVKDNELRWQLHRTKWWQPMGKAYYLSGNEEYAKEWVFQYMDWIKKNPLTNSDHNKRKTGRNAEIETDDNVAFAWRPLEVSHRLQDQAIQFLLFLNSPYFTPEFLSCFLINYDRHAKYIRTHYSERGNHLLFEAQRLMYAGVLFPELKEAAEWRSSGLNVLNREIKKQVYDDGMQYELDPHYHLAAINIFAKAIRIADLNGFKSALPKSFLDTVEKMIMVVINTCFPDYTNPLFSDAKLETKKEQLKNFGEWAKIYPDNKAIEYRATDRKGGEAPDYLSIAFKTSGFYVFRNAWDENATQMTLKAGPPAFWHCQPDNGTFELYFKGRNFFFDSGSYVYGGNDEVLAQRNWFRRTMVHKTLTLNNANLEKTDTKLLLWQTGDKEDILVVENPSYPLLTHRRSVFFLDKEFFVIIDEAFGDATGNVAIHYQLCEGETKYDKKNYKVSTCFADNNNVFVQCFPPKGTMLCQEEGWVSYKYRQKNERPAFAFASDKKDNAPVRFISVIMPVENEQAAPLVCAEFGNKQFSEKGLFVKLKVGKKKYVLKYSL